MKSFMKNLHEHINFYKLDISNLAEKAGMDRTSFNRILNGKIKEMKLESFLAIAPDLYEDWKERRKKINEFIMFCESDLNIKKALCYCQTIGEYRLMRKLIKKYIEHDKKEKIRKYLHLYNTYNQRNLNKLKGQKLLDNLNEVSLSKSAHYQVVSDMLIGFAMYDLQNYMAMIPHSKKIERNMLLVDNVYIKRNLELQHEDRKAHIKLFSNEIDECRNICKHLIEEAPDYSVIKAKALSCLAESYMLEKPYQSEIYFLESLGVIKKIGVTTHSKLYKAIHTTLAFLRIEYGFNLDRIVWKYVNDEEKAFYDAKFGSVENAKQYFSRLKKEGKEMSAFKLYYSFYVEDDIMILKEALEKFSKDGNLFYSNFITRMLMKEGVK